MKTAERVVIVAILLVFLGIGLGGYYAVQNERTQFREQVAAGEFEIPDEVALEPDYENQTDWRRWYPNTVPMKLAGVQVKASVADTMSSRIKGLSDTPYLPDDVVKLFVFGVPGSHSIWMKDMNYAIDILWLSEDGFIVHIEEKVDPGTFPNSFASPVPAWFVVEANAGFVETNNIELGDELILPTS